MTAPVTRLLANRQTLVDSETSPAPEDCKPEVLCRVPGWMLSRQSRHHAWEWLRAC